MDRRQLVNTLKSAGYADAKPTLESVNTYIADNFIELVTETGDKVDVSKAWNTAASVTVAPAQNASDVRGTNAPHAPIVEPDTAKGVHTFGIGNGRESMARKAYNDKVKRGQAVFSDADTAEAFTASMRLAVVPKSLTYNQREADESIVRKTGVTFTNTLGGALVPQEFYSTLIYLTEMYGVAMRTANVQRMSSDVGVFPRKTSIPTMNYTAEAATISEQDNGYDNVSLVAKKGTVLMRYSRELFQDSAISVADDYARSMAEAVQKGVDEAYFLGDGSGTYGNQTGLANGLPAGSSVTAAGTSFASVTATNLTTLMGLVENVVPGRCELRCSRQFAFQVLKRLDTAASQFKDTQEGPFGIDGYYLGIPYRITQVLPTAGTTAQRVAYFGDFIGGSMIGDRQQLEIATSTEAGFATDTILVRGTIRFNVNIHGDGRGSTVGPISSLVLA
jgi:HK97 family phage major capsid protein